MKPVEKKVTITCQSNGRSQDGTNFNGRGEKADALTVHTHTHTVYFKDVNEYKYNMQYNEIYIGHRTKQKKSPKSQNILLLVKWCLMGREPRF